jgi:hypothetical protein
MGRAESLCCKRSQFSHENEVRLLCIGPDKLGTGDNVKHFPIDPNTLFTEVAFDPRLVKFEQVERITTLRALNFTGAIREDTSYVGTFVVVPMASDWLDPE